MMSIEQAAAAFFADLEPVRAGDGLFCALSGGPDSVALFHLLRTIAPARGLQLAALHLNHGLRGEQADRDEAFVRRLCEKYHVPLVTEQARMSSRVRPAGESEESFARTLRYDFFERAATKMERDGCRRVWVATAHTASDNAETLLFRLVRGCELNGAGGIPPVRERYLRPLLAVTRSQILEYCEKNGYAYVTDETNLQPFCSRNQIRLEVMPTLRGSTRARRKILQPLQRRCGRTLLSSHSWAKSCCAGQMPAGAGAAVSLRRRRHRYCGLRWPGCCQNMGVRTAVRSRTAERLFQVSARPGS